MVSGELHYPRAALVSAICTLLVHQALNLLRGHPYHSGAAAHGDLFTAYSGEDIPHVKR